MYVTPYLAMMLANQRMEEIERELERSRLLRSAAPRPAQRENVLGYLRRWLRRVLPARAAAMSAGPEEHVFSAMNPDSSARASGLRPDAVARRRLYETIEHMNRVIETEEAASAVWRGR